MLVVESSMAGGRKEVALAAIAVITTVMQAHGTTKAVSRRYRHAHYLSHVSCNPPTLHSRYSESKSTCEGQHVVAYQIPESCVLFLDNDIWTQILNLRR